VIPFLKRKTKADVCSSSLTFYLTLYSRYGTYLTDTLENKKPITSHGSIFKLTTVSSLNTFVGMFWSIFLFKILINEGMPYQRQRCGSSALKFWPEYL
jgi:hypothetical protein